MGDSENKRKRLTQACELCRRKKIRCDGGKPQCGNCARLNNECTYSTHVKKRGPRQGYIEMLEQRLAKMEKILLSSDSSQQTEEQEEKEQTRVKRGRPNKSSVDQQQQQQQLPTSPASFSSASSFPSPSMLLPQYSSSDDNKNGLPPVSTLDHFVDLFFANIYPLCPIMNEAAFRRDIHEGKCSEFLLFCLSAACARFSERPDIKQNPPWRAGERYAERARQMLIKVMDEPCLANLQGITLLSLHEYGCGRGPRCWMYVGMAIRMSMELGLHENTQADGNATLDKLFEQETARRTFWTVFTMDKFSSAATGRPSTLQDTFCTAFLPAKVCTAFLPAKVCTSGGVSQYYTENLDGSQQLHLNIPDVTKSMLLGSFSSSCPAEHQRLNNKVPLDPLAYFTRASNILGKVTTFVNKKCKDFSPHPYQPQSEVYQLNKMIDDWYNDLPEGLKNTPTNHDFYANTPQQGPFIMLHILHNAIIVLLHRPALIIADTIDNEVVLPELKAYVMNSVRKCLNSVNNVTILIKKIGDRRDMMPPYLTYLVYTVATVIVSNSFSSKSGEAEEARQSLGVYFQILLSARSYWAMADRLYFMIRDLYTMHANMIKRQRDPASNVGQSTPELLHSLPAPFFFQQQSSHVADLPSQEPASVLNNTDWTLPFTMQDQPRDSGLYGGLINSPLDFSTSLFPPEFNQPLGFSSFSDPPSSSQNK